MYRLNIIHQIIILIIVAFLIYFISGRLIGSGVNIFKRIFSVLFSITFTTFIYWYTYLRHYNYKAEEMVEGIINVTTILWIGSMLLISMLVYLFLELFDPIAIEGKKGERRFFGKRILNYWRYQKRLRTVLKIAVTNGITSTVKFARYRESERELAIALRNTLEQCGGIFIKFGQVLSTRKELFSPIFIEELEKLQQNVTEIPEEQVKEILKNNLPDEIENIFSHFELEPIAAASIGQVHKATLKKNNEQVVVKILRPEIKEIMNKDLNILLEFANWISTKSQWAKNIGFQDIAEGFANSLKEEIDFEIEVRNMIQISNVFQKSKAAFNVKIPKVFKEYCNENIIVMEFAEGVTVAESDEIFARTNFDRNEVAKSLLFTYFEQALISGIFHADPHPGNIYFNEKTGELSILDFGAVCRLSSQEQEGLKLFFVGIHQGDASVLYDGISLLVKKTDDLNRKDIEQAINQILLKVSYVDKIPSDEIVYSIFSVIRNSGLQMYPSVSVAMRVVVTLDGTLSIIDPNFNIFEETKLFFNKYMRKSLSETILKPMETVNKVEEELAIMIPNLKRFPRRISQFIKKIEDGKLILHHDIFSDKTNAKFVTELFSKFVLLMVGITFGIISTALLAISQLIETAYAIYLNTAAYLGLFLCAILLVRLSIQAIRDMRKDD